MKIYDYVVIGGGSDGIVSANHVEMHGANVPLIEGSEIGKTHIDVGRASEKVMWQASGMMEMIERDTAGYGLDIEIKNSSFKQLVENRKKYIDFLHSAYNRGLDSNNIEHIHGYATFTGEQATEVNGTEYMASYILTATDGRPKKLGIPGKEYALDSNGSFALEEVLKRVVSVGTGCIVAELIGILHGLSAETY